MPPFPRHRRLLAGILIPLAAAATLLLPAAPAAAVPEAGQYVPVSPVTVVDNVSLPAGGTTTATVTGVGGVPAAAGVSTVAVNLIANQPAGSGYLQLFPAGGTPPVDSTLNFQQGRTTANFEVVPVPDHGRISVFSTTATKVIVRVRGCLTISPHTDDGGTFTPVPPATEVGNVAVPAGGITSFRVTGANGVPTPGQVSAVALNVIAAQPSGNGWLQAYPEGDRPVDSTLNFQQGRNTAGFEVVRVPADGRISIYSTTATRVIVRLRAGTRTRRRPPGPTGASTATCRSTRASTPPRRCSPPRPSVASARRGPPSWGRARATRRWPAGWCTPPREAGCAR